MNEIDDGWESLGHRYVDGEWIEAYRTPDGSVVGADGQHVPPGDYAPEPYVRTVVVDGERFHERQSADGSGTTSWYDDDGNAVGAIVDLAGTTPIHPPGTIHAHDGQLYRTVPTDTGETIVLDADGNEAGISVQQLTDDLDVPTFGGLVDVDGRRAVIGIDADGERELYTPQGEPIGVRVRRDQVEAIDPGPLPGSPIAIGDYAMPDGGTERVYLFRDGSQAIRGDDGQYARVIVPTDAEYPAGHAYFEGAFPVGLDHSSSSAVEVFSFADGQTALRLDSELVLVDTDLTTTHPGAAPVSCGDFPGGELFVFPDGTQLIHRDDGTWALGQLPDLPPYDELLDRFGAPDPAAIDEVLMSVPRFGPGSIDEGPLDAALPLLDDITGLPGNRTRPSDPDASVADNPAPSDTAPESDVGLDEPTDQGGAMPDIPMPTPDGSNNSNLPDIGLGDGLGTPLDNTDLDEELIDPFDDPAPLDDGI